MSLISKSFRDFSLTFEKNAVTNDILSLKNEAAIKESVKNIVLYNFYEKPSSNYGYYGLYGNYAYQYYAKKYLYEAYDYDENKN